MIHLKMSIRCVFKLPVCAINWTCHLPRKYIIDFPLSYNRSYNHFRPQNYLLILESNSTILFIGLNQRCITFWVKFWIKNSFSLQRILQLDGEERKRKRNCWGKHEPDEKTFDTQQHNNLPNYLIINQTTIRCYTL